MLTPVLTLDVRSPSFCTGQPLSFTNNPLNSLVDCNKNIPNFISNPVLYGIRGTFGSFVLGLAGTAPDDPLSVREPQPCTTLASKLVVDYEPLSVCGYEPGTVISGTCESGAEGAEAAGTRNQHP